MKRALLLLGLIGGMAQAADPVQGLDQPTPSPLLAPQEDRGTARPPATNPEGAPTVPHAIDGYQLTLSFNRCLSCHGRKAPRALEAPRLPASHRRDRDGNAHPALAGARYPCTSCHVPQRRQDQEEAP